MAANSQVVSQERIPLPKVEGAYYQVMLRLDDLRYFFADHPAEDLVSFELMADGNSNLVRIGMMNPEKMAYGTFACIEKVRCSIRGFYQSGSTIFLTGKNLAEPLLAYESRFEEVTIGLAAARLRDGALAKWISFHGVNNSSFAFDGLLWRSLIPCDWLQKDRSHIRPMDSQYAPSARIVGLMDGYAYGLGMEVQDEEAQDPDITAVKSFRQRVLFRETHNPAQAKPEWRDKIVEHGSARVRGVGFMARTNTQAMAIEERPRSGYMPAKDSIFFHLNYANGTVSTLRYSPGCKTPAFSHPEVIEGWPMPPTVLAVVRPDAKRPAQGVIVQELRVSDGACLLHYLSPEQVPTLYLPYLESFRP